MDVLIVDDEALARNELKYLLNQCEGVSLIIEASTIQEALEILLTESIDLAFLDIQLTNESGLDLADKIAKMPHPPEFVFATAYDEYAIEAFEKNARDYILKPFELERVQEAVRRIQARSNDDNALQEETQSLVRKSVPIQDQDRIIMVNMSDILAMEVSKGETKVYTKEKVYHTQVPLTYWEQKLGQQAFMRVHRSFIVKIDAIKEIQPWFNHTYQLTIADGLKVPVSRSYIKRFKEKVGL
ncbi:LytTR family transcriptional regulator DNA-binding domain-containing protein [Tetragenococcus koreensis]|uniref:Two-component system response regulator n=1 Tax=Tetragenococcus koreensis TaxID=290335 RepID=A0AAN4RKF7_9ENTE|nr:LytTR family transcriptional regulator DNA-binding domain-containing protein [Tetragenococcus koreensis]MCF1584500.1 LytTR family transcriptional regulator DNA-binding domain-containing protein [Tetragenococcus koreensis]MCF1614049.1 LytTR family transcriptional regulator DNA-binding domain-containing protein [Tetragenococcus koreensis]MCF1616559.1 LytTR family transcriptional regulator DNA-binding domain-containing protein [Tetragenococcus koreensis]MCF1620524.1 LytTR family transcriptional